MASTFDALRWSRPRLLCGLASVASFSACSESTPSTGGPNTLDADSSTAQVHASNAASTVASPNASATDAVEVDATDAGITPATPSVESSTFEGTPTLFWLDVSGKVFTSETYNFRARTLVRSAGRGSDGIAVDTLHGYIYWTNMGVPSEDDGTLMRADLDGGNVTTLIPAGHTFTPKQLKLEPTAGQLYWSDREGMRVMRASLDGDRVETLYTAGEGATARREARNWCVGIAIDVAGGYFYWTQKGADDEHTGSIRRAPLEMASNETSATRTDVEILFAELAAPVDLELDLEADHVYWTNRGDDTVNRAPIAIPAGETASTRSDREVLVSGATEAIGIAIDHRRGLLYYTTAVGDLGRANLDGSEVEYLQNGNGALTGIAVVELP